jgi:hypothetical protein
MLVERLTLLVRRENLQTLHQRQTGIDHDRELPEKDGDVLGLDLARPEGRHGELFPLLPHRSRRDPLPPQLLHQNVFVGSIPFS